MKGGRGLILFSTTFFFNFERICTVYRIGHIIDSKNCVRCAGTFEWIDSLLVKAMKNGDWLLLDDVNLCNPSVLDRLNAFLEPDGALSIHERGIATADDGVAGNGDGATENVDGAVENMDCATGQLGIVENINFNRLA